ncbi:nucleoside transporter C-terminal domain-containing protein [Kordia sp.]|uniref:nucleoside transporter C-terminal domain-containing protein n=1 Tax=Kordia sp. TaxID=1965332 RepID=UPI003D2DFFF9
MRKFIASILTVFCVLFSVNAQEIDGTWNFSNIQNSIGENIIPIAKNDKLTLKTGEFQYQLAAKNNLKASGDYIYQNNLLVFYYNQPTDTIRKYKITSLTDSTLVFNEKGVSYHFTKKQEKEAQVTATTNSEVSQIIPSEGFSTKSLIRGILGMFVLLVIAFLCSSNRKAINWKTVGLGLAFQLIIAIGVLKIDAVKNVFEGIGQVFINILNYTKAGSEFLFGGMMNVESFGFIFAFQVLPTIIFFSALTSVLFYLGLIQRLVKGMAWVLTKILGISGAESLSVAGNIFLGQTEAPLLIKAYLERMTRSEILLVMIGGMATVAGAVLAAYIGFLGGDDPDLQLVYAKHLLAASVMAAPGAIVISKILYPQQEKIDNNIEVSQEKIGSNILDAIANGTTEGLKLAVNVGAMLLVFVAFIAMFNGILGGLAGFDGFTITSLNIDWHFTSLNEIIAANTPYDSLSLEFILGYLFAPLMWLIGVDSQDMSLMGQLLGIKLAASEFIGYIQLAELKNVANATHLTYNKSIIMATYMLCGFANFASIGIQIGGIGSLAPGQRKTLSEFGIKALIGGTIASLISATIAGMLIG